MYCTTSVRLPYYINRQINICMLTPPIRSDEGGYVLGLVDYGQLGYSQYYKRTSMTFLKGLGIAQGESDQILLAIHVHFLNSAAVSRISVNTGSSCIKSLVVAALLSAEVEICDRFQLLNGQQICLQDLPVRPGPSVRWDVVVTPDLLDSRVLQEASDRSDHAVPPEQQDPLDPLVGQVPPDPWDPEDRRVLLEMRDPRVVQVCRVQSDRLGSWVRKVSRARRASRVKLEKPEHPDPLDQLVSQVRQEILEIKGLLDPRDKLDHRVLSRDHQDSKVISTVYLLTYAAADTDR